MQLKERIDNLILGVFKLKRVNLLSLTNYYSTVLHLFYISYTLSSLTAKFNKDVVNLISFHSLIIEDVKLTPASTATRMWKNKRSNEQNNSSAKFKTVIKNNCFNNNNRKHTLLTLTHVVQFAGLNSRNFSYNLRQRSNSRSC